MLADKYLARLGKEGKEKVLQFLDRERYAFIAQIRYPKRKFIGSEKTPITETK